MSCDYLPLRSCSHTNRSFPWFIHIASNLTHKSYISKTQRLGYVKISAMRNCYLTHTGYSLVEVLWIENIFYWNCWRLCVIKFFTFCLLDFFLVSSIPVYKTYCVLEMFGFFVLLTTVLFTTLLSIYGDWWCFIYIWNAIFVIFVHFCFSYFVFILFVIKSMLSSAFY